MLRALGMFLAITCGSVALGCTCVTAAPDGHDEAKDESFKTFGVSYVLEGRVISTEKLPSHREMRGRGRQAVTFEVNRYWHGQPGRRITMYVLDPGTDCLGDSFDVGKTYLVFANLNRAQDHKADGFFWYGWLDVLKEGADIVEPVTACVPTGEIDKLRPVLKRLGKGRVPK